jgi:hypothetical protein
LESKHSIIEVDIEGKKKIKMYTFRDRLKACDIFAIDLTVNSEIVKIINSITRVAIRIIFMKSVR